MIALALVAMALISLVLVGAFHRSYQALVADNLRAYATLLAADANARALAEAPADDYRLTLIDKSGNVLYDNEAEIAASENHASRAEVIAARESGEGEAIRRSATLGYNTYYYAKLLPDGNVLRVSTEAVRTAALFGDALPWVGLSAVLTVALSVLVSMLFTRRLIRVIGSVVSPERADAPQADSYAELIPLADAVSQQRASAQENERMRREFTANVSHELKTPLTSVRGYAEMIESGMARDADIPAFARRIREESERMVSLVRDIVELSELDEGKAAEAFERLDLAALAADTASLLRFSAEQSNVTLDVSVQSAYIMGSRTLVEELVYNLCDNAIRYNVPGGSVSVSVLPADGYAALTVADTGIGIPKESHARIFERFYRVDKSRSRRTGGTGLGLAIVKHIAKLHRASIHVESEVGRGTTMTVRFALDG